MSTELDYYVYVILLVSVADQDPGASAFNPGIHTGSVTGKKPDP